MEHDKKIIINEAFMCYATGLGLCKILCPKRGHCVGLIGQLVCDILKQRVEERELEIKHKKQ